MKETPEELRAILYSIADAVITTDLAGRVVLMNEVAEKLTGWKEDEAGGKPCAEIFRIVNEKTRAVVENPVDRVLNEGRAVELANGTVLLSRDGAEYPIADSGAPIRDKAGTITGVVLVFRDQTAERQARAALVESERKLSTLMGNLPGMAYRVRNDPDWTIEFLSEGGFELTGYSQAELLEKRGAAYAALIHPEDRQRVWDTVQAGVEARRPFELEYRIITADGREKWVWERGRGIFSAANELQSLEGFVTDITDRKHAIEALARSEREKSLILDTTGELFAYYDLDLHVQWVNRASAESVGMRPEEMVGMHCYELWHGCGAPCPGCPVIKAKETGQPQQAEMHSPDGRHWLLRGYPVLDDDGQVTALIEFGQDITERKRAADALDEQMQLMQYIVRNDPNAIAVYDRDLKYLAVSDRYLSDYDVRESDIIGRHHYDIFPEMPQRWKDVHQRCLAGAVERNDDDCFKRPDGSITYNRWECQPWYRADGQIGGIITYTEVTSERKLAELALRNTKMWLEAATRAGRVGLWDWDLSTDRVTYSDEWKRQIGYEPHEIGDTLEEWSSRVHPEDLESTLAKIRDHVEKEHPGYEVEFRFRHKDGSYRWILAQASVFRDEAGKAARVLGSHVDITDRKQAEKDLEHHHAFLRRVIDTVPAFICVKDADGRHVLANRTLAEAYGTTVGRLEGRRDEDFSPTPEEIESFRRDDINVIANRRAAVIPEENITFADGTKHILSTSKSPLVEGDGSCDKLLAIAIDITDRKQAEEDRERLQGQLLQSQKMESVGRLAGGVAHDFNNMLQIILGHVDLVLENPSLDGDVRDSIAEVRNAAVQSADLTRQLLAFARKQTIAPQVVDLNEVIDVTFKMLSRLVGENIEMVYTPGNDLWNVRIDPSQVDQVLANLVVNARDAITGVGRIAIESANVTIDRDYCAGHPDFRTGDFVRLSVSDDGCGMPPEVLGQVFEPFFTTKEVGRGTGLGLATVYGIIKQNDGFINVYSEPGQGTRFHLYLPRDETPARPQPARTSAEPVGGQETILLVEDEVALLSLAERTLENLGYAVLSAASPTEAMRLTDSHAGTIDLLITDVVMPEMNGSDLARQLQASRRDLKVLYMSGYTADVIAHQGVLNEGVRFIEKPFSLQALAAAVREVLES